MTNSFDIQPTRLPDIKVLIADDRKLFRQGLISLFATELGILVVGDTNDGIEAVRLASSKKPDIVIMNINLDTLDGIGAANRMRKASHTPEFIFTASHHNELLMKEAFAVGGRAYLLQNCDFKELVFAIRKVAAGDYYLTGPAGHEMVLEYINASSPENKSGDILTRREKELCRLLSDGYSTKEAAVKLSISVKTAETHRASIMKKIRGKNVTDIVKFCIRNKIVDL
ncbi:MAG: response regulator transcription factor [candidate division Zixibacteria bacterium]|nr:response regulator transcription factor [candidate division Zixibacteria bacterium]